MKKNVIIKYKLGNKNETITDTYSIDESENQQDQTENMNVNLAVKWQEADGK